MRKKYSGLFKFKVALEAIKGDRTISDICLEYNITSGMVHNWKKQLSEHGVEIFDHGTNRHSANSESEKAKLYEEIGRLKVEVDFLKKVVGS